MFVEKYRKEYSIKSLCYAMGISRQTYYKYRKQEDRDYRDYLVIKEVFEEGKEIYGYRRLKKQLLQKYGWIINHKKLLRIMRKYKLRVKYQKIYKKNYWRIKEEKYEVEDLLKRDFKAQKENEKWCTDITYLIHKGKRAYLSTIIDLKDKKIVAYKISRKNDNRLVIDTLNEAIKRRKDVQGTILHSDHGYQYTSLEYRAVCESNGILRSMSRKGIPIDNSPIESFHASFKREVLYSNNITNIEKYIELAENWIKFYNTERIRL